jgi:hypothetical protein
LESKYAALLTIMEMTQQPRGHDVPTLLGLTMTSNYGKIPGKSEWEGFEADLDVRNAYKLLFGKSVSEATQYFGDVKSIQRADELLFMPRKAFQYYIFAFAEYLKLEKAAGDSDSASPFLRLLINREKRDQGSVAQIYMKLAPVVDFVSAHQDYFEADKDIYGDFRELAIRIRETCQA